MTSINDQIEAVRNFKAAAKLLDSKVDDNSMVYYDQEDDYPFDTRFDELVDMIDRWCSSMIKNMTKQLAEEINDTEHQLEKELDEYLESIYKPLP